MPSPNSCIQNLKMLWKLKKYKLNMIKYFEIMNESIPIPQSLDNLCLSKSFHLCTGILPSLQFTQIRSVLFLQYLALWMALLWSWSGVIQWRGQSSVQNLISCVRWKQSRKRLAGRERMLFWFLAKVMVPLRKWAHHSQQTF